MEDPLDKITEGKDLIGKIKNTVAGFLGYVDRENRRDADKILREGIAQRIEKQWSRISEIQRDMVSEGKLELVDDLEAGAIKLRQFADRLKTAAYGYAGFFDAVRVKSDELEKLYAFDVALLDKVDEVKRAIDNIEASIGSDGLPAALRHLRTISQEAIDIFDQRKEVILSTEV
ncbi:MAG: hypothetical protein PVF85_08995 [Anaerolineales bacterium]|jgi:hypothetical protein